eukprot:318133-Hanusia_phi.AAC.1
MGTDKPAALFVPLLLLARAGCCPVHGLSSEQAMHLQLQRPEGTRRRFHLGFFLKLRASSCRSRHHDLGHVREDVMGLSLLGAGARGLYPPCSRTNGLFLQTMTGSAMGIILHYWSPCPAPRCSSPYTMQEHKDAFILHYPGVDADSAGRLRPPHVGSCSIRLVCSQRSAARDNLLAWFCWGVAFQLFAAILICRHYCSLGILSRMRYSIQTTLRALELQGDPLQGSSVRLHPRMSLVSEPMIRARETS